jgi:phosphoglycerate dehydrogenase-like enzyme
VSAPRILVTFSPASPEIRQAIVETLEPVATISFLPEIEQEQRAAALGSADALLVWNVARELSGPDEPAMPRAAHLIQFVTAGVDRVPFDQLPAGVPVASNAGAFTQPMAEHVLALALALAKRLPQNHAALALGEFNQQTPTLAIDGSLVAVLGFGGIGQASAKLFRALGARVHAVNRSGQTDQTVDSIGTLADLDEVLAAADILVLSLPLTRATEGMLGARELALMKPEAILVNVARAAIIDEDAMYEHLRRNPSFSAGIDTWWQEPRGGGKFATRRPFFELPNVIGSPHNSAIVAGALTESARRAAANVARALRGEPVQNLVDRSDYVD